jgi:hypothetical protein
MTLAWNLDADGSFEPPGQMMSFSANALSRTFCSSLGFGYPRGALATSDALLPISFGYLHCARVSGKEGVVWWGTNHFGGNQWRTMQL